MTDPTAEPDDVRLEVETSLENSRIQSLIDRFSRDIYRAYDIDDFENDDHRQDFEAAYTALQIAGRYDRTVSRIVQGSASIQYEGDPMVALRQSVSDLEPGDELVNSGVIRNTDRHVTRVSSEDCD